VVDIRLIPLASLMILALSLFPQELFVSVVCFMFLIDCSIFVLVKLKTGGFYEPGTGRYIPFYQALMLMFLSIILVCFLYYGLELIIQTIAQTYAYKLILSTLAVMTLCKYVEDLKRGYRE